jgi:4-amino-4-deoxy-L-arabinose transferase-like glycosyltransferase
MMKVSIRRRDLLPLLLVVLFSAAACLIVFSNFALQRGQMMWDEAEHAMTGLVFASDIQRLDMASLAIHSYRQILWPPLHPLMLSAFFLLFGQSAAAARASSIALYFLFSMAMYFLGREIAQKNKPVSGILCSVFALVTGSLYLSASEVMLEMIALLFFSLAMLFFLRFLRDKGLWWTVPVFILLTFFSKTNFGIVLILSVAAYFLVHERFRIVSLLRNRSFLLMLGPVIIVILTWLLIPPDRLLVFLGALVNRPEGPPSFSVEGLMYYPVQLYVYSGVLILLFAAAFALSFRYLKDEKVRFLIIIAVIAIILNFFHQNKKIRYILYLYPPLFTLAAFHLTGFYARINHKRRHITFFVLVLACTAAFMFYLAGNARLYGYDFSVAGPLDFIKNSTGNSTSIFVLGEINEISPGLISWHISNITDIKSVTASTYAAWEFEDPEAPGRANPERINDYIGKYDFDVIILIETFNGSVFYNTEDFLVYNKWKLDYIPILLENRNYTIRDSRLFQDIGIGITVLKRIGN